MKREDVTNIFNEATKEQINALLDLNSKDIGEAKADYNQIKSQLEALITEKATLEGKVAELQTVSGDAEKYKADLEALKKQIDDDKAETKRKADEAKLEEEYTTRFQTVVGENKWRDELTGKAVYQSFKEAVASAENKGKGDREIFEILTKDQNYYENPNKPANMVEIGEVTIDANSTMRAAMGLPPLK